MYLTWSGRPGLPLQSHFMLLFPSFAALPTILICFLSLNMRTALSSLRAFNFLFLLFVVPLAHITSPQQLLSMLYISANGTFFQETFPGSVVYISSPTAYLLRLRAAGSSSSGDISEFMNLSFMWYCICYLSPLPQGCKLHISKDNILSLFFLF